MKSMNIGFIGAGNMANSLIRGLVSEGRRGSTLWAADLDSAKLQTLRDDCGINIATSPELANHTEVIVLAVKPQVMQVVCEELSANLKSSTLIISIAAGITVQHLQSWLGNSHAIVRCMPNTPALVSKGASGLYANDEVSEEQKNIATQIADAVGISVWVESESDIDTVTAISGSGPAYFFLFIEAMQNAAEGMGLSKDVARTLSYQTAVGAAELALDSDDSIAELRRKVTSPGGTTERAIQTFEKGGLRDLVNESLLAARDRSVELAAQLGE